MSRNFTSDKQLSVASESMIISLLNSKGYNLEHQASDVVNFPYYDIAVYKNKDRALLIEVKTDNYDNDNVAIEAYSNSNPSGINTTVSEFYVIHKTATDKLYQIRTANLRKIVSKKVLIPMNGGATECYLVSLDEFKPLVA